MTSILTILTSFIVFLVILEKCWYFSSPLSLIILIAISLLIGSIIASLLSSILGIAIIFGVAYGAIKLIKK